MRSFDQRNSNVAGARLTRCVRRSKYNVNCRFHLDGEVGSLRTTCNVGVVVRGEGSMTRARLQPVCRSYRELAPDRGMRAMKEKAEQIAGKPVEIIGFSRHSQLYFVGQGIWTQQGAGLEECSVYLVAHLLSSDRVRVEARELECAAVPTG